MNNRQVFIRKIEQKDNYTLMIVWSDGLIRDYRLSNLQAMCPCVRCNDGKLEDRQATFRDVRAKRIVNVGRYAIRIEFTSGCSSGIYQFDFLHSMGEISS